MVENDMQIAENNSRKNAQGAAGDRLANAARLGALEKHLGVPIKRYRDPGNVGGKENPFHKSDIDRSDQDEVIVVGKESG